jgi:dCMP deaminase
MLNDIFQQPPTHKSACTINHSIMQLVELWAKCRSKDPNTKVGACVYDPRCGGMYFGYNGFAQGILDTKARWERPTKYEYVIHAEDNALIKAYQALGSDVARCVLYVTHKPCHKCMSKIIQSGIRIVYYKIKHDDSQITDGLAYESGISLSQLDDNGDYVAKAHSIVSFTE